jgi:hypothetical protein
MNVMLRWGNLLDEKGDGWELELLHEFLVETTQIKKP